MGSLASVRSSASTRWFAASSMLRLNSTVMALSPLGRMRGGESVAAMVSQLFGGDHAPLRGFPRSGIRFAEMGPRVELIYMHNREQTWVFRQALTPPASHVGCGLYRAAD